MLTEVVEEPEYCKISMHREDLDLFTTPGRSRYVASRNSGHKSCGGPITNPRLVTRSIPQCSSTHPADLSATSQEELKTSASANTRVGAKVEKWKSGKALSKGDQRQDRQEMQLIMKSQTGCCATSICPCLVLRKWLARRLPSTLTQRWTLFCVTDRH